MNFFQWISLATGALQATMNIIPLVERKGNGEQKKQLVVNATNAIVNTALVASGGAPLNEPGNQLVNQLSGGVTEMIVGFLNNIGEFQTTPKPPVEVATKDNVVVLKPVQ